MTARNRLLLVVLGALAATGCGGGSKKPTAVKPDPGRAVFDRLVDAARRHDAGAIWDRVTAATHGRLTRQQAAAEVEQALAPVTHGSYRTLISQLVTQSYGVVAVKSPTAVVALAFRKEGGTLRADVGAPLAIDVSGPQPGVHPQSIPHQVAVELKGADAAGATVVLYLDGETLYPKVYGGATSATVYADLSVPFPRARHTVLAFAATRNAATARAWSFVIR